MKDVLANPDKPWNYMYLSQKPCITLEDVLANPDKPWDYEILSGNRFGIPENKGIVAMEKEAKARTIARTKLVKEELMMVCWNPARAHIWWDAEGMHKD